MSDAADDSGSRAKHDPVTGNPEGLPDLYGEGKEKKPLVEDASVNPDDD
jgi:hypothetical protein